MLTTEQYVADAISQLGPRCAYETLIAENNRFIRQPELNNGREIAAARTAIHTALVRTWAREQQETLGYTQPFAVVALGGTGRGEMTPRSDTDFALLLDGPLEGNKFLLELQRQAVNSNEFESTYGFRCHALPFSFDDVPALSGKDLNSFLDMSPVHDPEGLTALFRKRIHSTYDPLEHFLHVRGFWKGQWEKAAGEFERLDAFDIKNDGLRIFLAAIWTQAGSQFVHSDDPRDLQAYFFLLRIRMFIHSRRTGPPRPSGGGNHPEDILSFEDFNSFGELLGPEATEPERFEYANLVRQSLLSARRRVAHYAKGIIELELRNNREISAGSPIVYGLGGLWNRGTTTEQTPSSKSSLALSLLLAAQRYDLPIATTELQSTFRNAGDWLIRVPELSELFYETRGSMAKSFAFLSQLDGAEERLFPGYASFESSQDERVRTEQRSLRSALERNKILALEQLVQDGHRRAEEAVGSARPDPVNGSGLAAHEAALLDADQLAAIKLALKTKRLPVTDEDLVARNNTSLELHDRYSTGMSGIPLADYFQPFETEAGFRADTLRLVEFLINHRRAFKECSAAGLSDDQQLARLVVPSGDEQRLRCLFVFTCADRAEWDSERTDPTRWWNTRELYLKAMGQFKPLRDPAHSLKDAGFSADQVAILKDFGEDFYTGVYRPYASRFGAHLARLGEEPDFADPKAVLITAGTSTLIGVAARDYPGLAATISGAFWQHGIELRQAHFFSAMNYNLALNFFHLARRDKPLPGGFIRFLEAAIALRQYINDSDESTVPGLDGKATIREWQSGLFRLRFETTEDRSGLVYALTYRVHRHLGGNIYGLTAHGVRRQAYISVYHTLPSGMTVDQAQRIVDTKFGANPDLHGDANVSHTFPSNTDSTNGSA